MNPSFSPLILEDHNNSPSAVPLPSTIPAGNRIYIASKMPFSISTTLCDMIAEEKQLQKAATPCVNN